MDVDAGSHYIDAVPETHVMKKASDFKSGQVIIPEKAWTIEFTSKLEFKAKAAVSEELTADARREKVMNAGRKVMDEYETTFRILAK